MGGGKKEKNKEIKKHHLCPPPPIPPTPMTYVSHLVSSLTGFPKEKNKTKQNQSCEFSSRQLVLIEFQFIRAAIASRSRTAFTRNIIDVSEVPYQW